MPVAALAACRVLRERMPVDVAKENHDDLAERHDGGVHALVK